MPGRKLVSAAFVEAFKVALASLYSSKLRSFLTLLGIILATATLITVMSVIHGMNRYIADNVSDMGADGFKVVRMAFIGDWDPKKFLELSKKNPQLRRDEYEFLLQNAGMTRLLGLEASRRVNSSVGDQKLEGMRLRGGTANLALITNTQTAAGRFFTESENQRRMAVTFIGNDLKETFFANVDALGKTVKLDGRPYTVVGVAKKQGSVFGQSLDNFAMIPAETYFKSYGSREGISYVAVALNRNALMQAQDEVRMLLRAYRHLGPGRDDTFAIVSSDSLVNAWDQMTGAIAATAIAVVSVFLVVGGVVIMNIMLAVVTERTHEIGVRKSVGARRRDILYQFLIESATLSAMGGCMGVAIAWGLGLAGRAFTPIPMAMPWTAVVVGVGLSSVVGLFFGIYPATRAAKLDPIEALRAER